MANLVIVIQCKDQVGLVAGNSGVLARSKINIISMREHVDAVENRFFTRLEVEGVADVSQLEKELREALPSDADVTVNPTPEKKIFVLVTKEFHCLSDILVRNHFGTLGAKVLGVAGNHAHLGDICRRFDIPFTHVSHEGKSKPEFEKELLAVLKANPADYIVLAKFMRILSSEFIRHFPMKMINIHHSFLPAFIGSSPYQQAFDRGVKLIGATGHFVTDDLDQGPIIAQQIIPVNHTHTASAMMKAGREIETAVLAKALNLVLRDKVFVYKNKTVVFE